MKIICTIMMMAFVMLTMIQPAIANVEPPTIPMSQAQFKAKLIKQSWKACKFLGVNQHPSEDQESDPNIVYDENGNCAEIQTPITSERIHETVKSIRPRVKATQYDTIYKEIRVLGQAGNTTFSGGINYKFIEIDGKLHEPAEAQVVKLNDGYLDLGSEYDDVSSLKLDVETKSGSNYDYTINRDQYGFWLPVYELTNARKGTVEVYRIGDDGTEKLWASYEIGVEDNVNYSNPVSKVVISGVTKLSNGQNTVQGNWKTPLFELTSLLDQPSGEKVSVTFSEFKRIFDNNDSYPVTILYKDTEEKTWHKIKIPTDSKSVEIMLALGMAHQITFEYREAMIQDWYWGNENDDNDFTYHLTVDIAGETTSDELQVSLAPDSPSGPSIKNASSSMGKFYVSNTGQDSQFEDVMIATHHTNDCVATGWQLVDDQGNSYPGTQTGTDSVTSEQITFKGLYNIFMMSQDVKALTFQADTTELPDGCAIYISFDKTGWIDNDGSSRTTWYNPAINGNTLAYTPQ